MGRWLLAFVLAAVGCGGSSIARVEDEGGSSSTTGNGGIAGALGSGGATTGGVSAGGIAGSVGGATGGSLGGAGGSGPPQVTCTDSDASVGFLMTYKTRGTAIGENGTFEDHCDGDGNLVETYCEMVCASSASRQAGDADPGSYARIRCPFVTSGDVLVSVVQCGGLCEDGMCFYWCPENPDTLSVEAIGELEVTFRSTDFSYRCATLEDSCASPSFVGKRVGVVHLSSCGLDTLNMTVDLGEPGSPLSCVYDCSWE